MGPTIWHDILGLVLVLVVVLGVCAFALGILR